MTKQIITVHFEVEVVLVSKLREKIEWMIVKLSNLKRIASPIFYILHPYFLFIPVPLFWAIQFFGLLTLFFITAVVWIPHTTGLLVE